MSLVGVHDTIKILYVYSYVSYDEECKPLKKYGCRLRRFERKYGYCDVM